MNSVNVTVLLALGLLIVGIQGRPSDKITTTPDDDSSEESATSSIGMTRKEELQVNECLKELGVKEDPDKVVAELMWKYPKEFAFCLSGIPSQRALVAFINVWQRFEGEEEGTIEICNNKFNFTDIISKGEDQITEMHKSTEEDDDEESDYEPFTITEAQLCTMMHKLILPEACAMKSQCSKEDAENSFALMYVSLQVVFQHPKQFSCPDRKGKDLMSTIINPEVYTFDINPEYNVLTKSLPCGKKSASPSGGKDNRGDVDSFAKSIVKSAALVSNNYRF